MTRACAIGALALTLVATAARAQAPKPAEPSVAAANQAVLSQLPFVDRQDFDDAVRGLVATTAETHTPAMYDFLKQEVSPTVNPSLWRQAQLNAIRGLFKIADGVYQVRGLSLSNMTVVEGSSGVIVVDPLMTVESAKEAMALYFANRPRKPVVAVIYTHSHVDHYGSVKGVITDADVAAGRTKVIAPAGFMDAVVSESVIAGNAMFRRGQYQFGGPLPRGERGNVDAGLGKIDPQGAAGRSLIAPTDTIAEAVETRTIDGVTMVFQLAPGSEAPAEMHFYLPRSRVLDIAENATHTLHNLLPLRGAEVRDAKAWSRYLSDALERFGADAEVMMAQHHWPVWGHARVVERLQVQRDLYEYVHDQTVRMMNQGFAPSEIAEALGPPPGLEHEWSTRGYYGTLSHDAKAVYQRYLGWYDGNPATLNALPPIEGAKKYVQYMGGADAAIARARDDFKAGRYRWVAEVMNKVVFAEPANRAARELEADALEQLGYLAESATWRNAYLLGARELRTGPPRAARRPAVDADTLHAMPLALVFDYLATTLNGPRAGTTRTVVNWHFADTRESVASTLEHGALTHVIGRDAPAADALVTLTRPVLEAAILRQRPLSEAVQRGEASITGAAVRVHDLMALFDDVDPGFAIVEPRK